MRNAPSPLRITRAAWWAPVALVSAGVACGTGLPFVIAPTVGYTPKFQIDPNQPDKRGAFDVGLSVGIHVPLIDLN